MLIVILVMILILLIVLITVLVILSICHFGGRPALHDVHGPAHPPRAAEEGDGS